MDMNIVVAGVGGQGILSIAFVLDNAAMKEGFLFKQAEVHGMAQRGGA
ncbi:MAG: 2-oxoacid:acceptor oxidoreductase family protein, partial [Planctomycetota bacterium]